MRRQILLLLGIIWVGVLSQTKLYGQEKTADSLEVELSKAKNDDQKAFLHISIFKNLNRSKPEYAQKHLHRAIGLSKKNTTDTTKALIVVSQIENHLVTGQYDSVFYYVDKAFEIEKHIKPKSLIDVYSMQGTVHYYKGAYAKAIGSHQEAEKICIEYNLVDDQAKVYNNIGIAYIKLENWSKAEEYMLKSLKICRELRVKRGMAYTLGNLGIIYKNQNKLDQAIVSYLESTKVSSEINDQRAISRNYDNLGSLYEEQENYGTALEYYTKGLELAEYTANKPTMANVLCNLGSLYTKENKFSKAHESFMKSLKIAKELGNKDIIRNNYLNLSTLHEKRGELDKAIAYRKLFENWKDSIINEQHLSAISELEIKYDTEKKKKELLALSEQKLQNEVTLQKQRDWIRRLSYGLGGALFMFGSIFIIFRQRSRNQKQKELISAIADTQIAERKRISQDLHDSVGGSLALAKTKLQALYEQEGGKSAELEESLKTLTETGEQVRQISHNLMPGELLKFGLVSAIQTTLDQLQDSELRAQLYAHDMEKRIDPAKEIHLFRIVQEIIQNVLKHAKADRLNVYLNKHKKHLNLMVEDNGVGMGGSSKSGMGIANIESRVAYLKGSFNIDSALGKGTTMNIQIPL